MLSCPKCRRIILDRTADGFKLRARMIVFTSEGEAEALCPTCKERVAVPITLDGSKIQQKPKLIIDKP